MFVVYGRGRKSCVQNIPSFRLFLVIKLGQLLFMQGMVYLGMVVCF